ncbi:MAG: hypothetical protein ACFE8G_14370 [Candidatus Hermodarchaeota archaeon]
MEEALGAARELVQEGRVLDPGLLEVFGYTVKGRKHKNEIVFVENYVDGDAINRVGFKTQDLPSFRKLGQLFETVDNLECSSIE